MIAVRFFKQVLKDVNDVKRILNDCETIVEQLLNYCYMVVERLLNDS